MCQTYIKDRLRAFCGHQCAWYLRSLHHCNLVNWASSFQKLKENQQCRSVPLRILWAAPGPKAIALLRVRQIISVLLKGRFGHRCLKKFKVWGRSLQCHSCCTTMGKVCTSPIILMTEIFSLLVRLLEDEPSWQFCLLALVECKN